MFGKIGPTGREGYATVIAKLEGKYGDVDRQLGSLSGRIQYLPAVKHHDLKGVETFIDLVKAYSQTLPRQRQQERNAHAHVSMCKDKLDRELGSKFHDYCQSHGENEHDIDTLI